jgi:hypothetical protein
MTSLSVVCDSTGRRGGRLVDLNGSGGESAKFIGARMGEGVLGLGCDATAVRWA